MKIRYFDKPVEWGAYNLQCLTCRNEWVLVAPVSTELECHRCGNQHIKILGDNRLCSPPERLDLKEHKQ